MASNFVSRRTGWIDYGTVTARKQVPNSVEEPRALNKETDSMSMESFAEQLEKAHAEAQRKADVLSVHEMFAKFIGRKVNQSSPIIYHEEPKDKYSLPLGTSHKKAIADLTNDWRAMEEQTEFNRKFPVLFEDGLYVLDEVLRRAFGSIGRGLKQYDMFGGEHPPEKLDIVIGLDDEGNSITRTVAASPVYVSHVDFNLEPGRWSNDEHPNLFSLKVTAKVMATDAVEGFFAMIEQSAREISIYRKKTLLYRKSNNNSGYTLQHTKREIDPTIVYSDEVNSKLENAIYGKLRYPEQLKQFGKNPLFKVILHGPLGTGKSAAMSAITVEAEKNDQTVIEYKPSGNETLADLQRVFNIAKMFAPAVILIEDFDKFFGPDFSSKDNSTLTNLFDGIDKSSRVSVVMTTNNYDQLPTSMTRAQRLTEQIQISSLDRNGIEHMMKVVLGDTLADDVDFDAVYEEVKDFGPAFVRSTFDNAAEVAIIRIAGSHKGTVRGFKLRTEDLLAAARSKADQHRMHKDAEERAKQVKSIPEQIAALQAKQQVDLITRISRQQSFEAAKALAEDGFGRTMPIEGYLNNTKG